MMRCSSPIPARSPAQPGTCRCCCCAAPAMVWWSGSCCQPRPPATGSCHRPGAWRLRTCSHLRCSARPGAAARIRVEAVSELFPGWRIWLDRHGWHGRRRDAVYLQICRDGVPAFAVHADTAASLALQLCWQQAADRHTPTGARRGSPPAAAARDYATCDAGASGRLSFGPRSSPCNRRRRRQPAGGAWHPECVGSDGPGVCPQQPPVMDDGDPAGGECRRDHRCQRPG